MTKTTRSEPQTTTASPPTETTDPEATTTQTQRTTTKPVTPKRATRRQTKKRHRHARHKPPRVTTLPATSGTRAYTGPNPLYCLQHSHLANARVGVEQGIWQANMPSTPLNDSTATIFISGPYANAAEATQYADDLLNIPETAAPAGRWVVSAAVTGHLSFQVNAVARCMAG